METRIINHNDGHIDTEALIGDIWVVTKCNLVLGNDELTRELRDNKNKRIEEAISEV